MKKYNILTSYLICGLVLLSSLGLLLSCSNPATINYFYASPPAITSGQSCYLEWDVRGTTRVNISSVGDVGPSGKAFVKPVATTTYLLTVPGGAARAAVTVVVNSPQVSGNPGTADTSGPNVAAEQTNTPDSASVILRYDNLNNTTEDYLSNQIAVWHTYAKLPGSASLSTAGYSQDLHKIFSSSNSTGVAVKSPLIILPFGQGMVCVVKNYSSLSYQFLKMGATWYGDTKDESDRLNQPGWGLMTSFTPEKSPFTIQKIDIAAAANNTGDAREYDDYHFIVRILDEKGNQVWSKLLPWSLFRGTAPEDVPKAVWRSIDVDNVVANGDFSVEILTESNECTQEKKPSYHYLALAYEKVKSKDLTSKSVISDNGQKADTWVRLYDAYGQPLSFNLCIRVEGH
jgi:hypothetical protein